MSENRHKLVSVQEVADYLSVTPLTVRRMVSRGELRAYRIGAGRTIRLDLHQVDNELLRPIPTAGGERRG